MKKMFTERFTCFLKGSPIPKYKVENNIHIWQFFINLLILITDGCLGGTTVLD